MCGRSKRSRVRSALGVVTLLVSKATLAGVVQAPAPVEIARSTVRIGPTGSPGEVTITVRVAAEGDPVRFLWRYAVRNDSYDPFWGNGFSGLQLQPIALILPEEFFDLAAPDPDWSTNVNYMGPYWWKQFGAGLMPGDTGDFSYRTEPRHIENSDGYYHTHAFGAPVAARYFDPGAGPLGPGSPYSIPPNAPQGAVLFLRGMPPNRYRCGNQPPYDNDLDSNGTPDSWHVPVLVLGPGGKVWPTRDEQDNEIVVAGIPDPAGPGCGSDHFSGRLRRPGGVVVGEEFGYCAYACGRNYVVVDFEDANGNGVPDRFRTSHWSSRNGDNIDCPFTGEMTDFWTDLTARKVVPIRTERRIPHVGPATQVADFLISDAAMVDLGTSLSEVELNGAPIGLPAGGDSLTWGATAMPPRLDLRLTGVAQAGADLAIAGLLANRDIVTHSYRWSTFGMGAAADTLGPIEVGPAATVPFTLSARLTTSTPDTVVIVALAYAETGAPEDQTTAVILHIAEPVDVTAGPHGAAALRLSIVPTPATSVVRILCQVPWTGELKLDVVDAAGRQVRQFALRMVVPDRVVGLDWDGRDDRGRPVANGVYWVRATSANGIQQTGRVVFAR